MADDITTQLSYFVTNEERMPAGLTVTVIEYINSQRDEIERLRGIAEELADAFQQVTDHGDACPICWESFKTTRKAQNCYGHAAVIELEARRG